MSGGIRTTIRFDDPDVCPIASLSARTETTINSVTTSVCTSSNDGCVTEFAIDASVNPGTEFQQVFSHGTTTRYRYRHDAPDTPGCPCECLGTYETPVSRYVARSGTLTIEFHAIDYDRLQQIVTELIETFPSTDVRRLLRSTSEEGSRDIVMVNRARLTARQLEVLETAVEMGYFERPRRTNATEIAHELGIDPSTFREHIAVAQSKLFDELI